MKLTLFLAAFSTASLLSSCNSVIGFGRDLKLLGGSMESASSNVQNKNSGGGGEEASSAPIY